MVSALGLPSWENSPSGKISLNYGDTLRINLSFKYKGSEQKGVYSLYAAIMTNKEVSWIDQWQGFNTDYVPFDVPVSLTGITITKTLNFKMPEASWLDTMGFLTHGGQDGAIYCKIHKDFLHEWFTPGYLNAIYLAAAVGDFTLLNISKFEKVA